MKRKQRVAPSPAVANSKAVRLGFSPAAQEFYEKLPDKTRTALDRKLTTFGDNPALGKPLVGELIGYYRVTVGRLRATAASSSAASIEALLKIDDGIVIVYVLFIGHRKAGSKDDPYERAASAIAHGDPDALEAMRLLAEQIKAGGTEVLDPE